MNLERIKFGLALLCIEVLLVILYVGFVGYDVQADASHRPNSINPSYGGKVPGQNSISKYDSSNCKTWKISNILHITKSFAC